MKKVTDPREAAHHYHTTDTVNGQKHLIRSPKELKAYRAATGNYGILVRDCYDPWCLDQEES